MNGSAFFFLSLVFVKSDRFMFGTRSQSKWETLVKQNAILCLNARRLYSIEEDWVGWDKASQNRASVSVTL
jgi:hypothetical protein